MLKGLSPDCCGSVKRFITIFFSVLVTCLSGCFLAPGSYPYSEDYEIDLPEEDVIKAIKAFKTDNPEFVVPGPVGYMDGRKDSADYWYHAFFYYSKENVIVNTWTRPVSRYKTTFAFVGLNSGLQLGNWKLINHDFGRSENKRQKKLFEERILNAIKNTTISEVPLSKHGLPYGYYRRKPQMEQYLNLHSLENGFDSLQIRIWYKSGDYETSNLFVLKSQSAEWQADQFNWTYQESVHGDSVWPVGIQHRQSVPRSGWQVFIGELNALELTTLQDSHSIKDYPDFADGSGVVVEVASKKRYRIYSYAEPKQAAKNVPEAARINAALELIENEFGEIAGSSH
ncbi:hypothetical protein [Flavihumibacter petaseus]|nr:hypothetical protein [Flavihumibacter petaseus]